MTFSPSHSLPLPLSRPPSLSPSLFLFHMYLQLLMFYSFVLFFFFLLRLFRGGGTRAEYSDEYGTYDGYQAKVTNQGSTRTQFPLSVLGTIFQNNSISSFYSGYYNTSSFFILLFCFSWFFIINISPFICFLSFSFSFWIINILSGWCWENSLHRLSLHFRWSNRAQISWNAPSLVIPFSLPSPLSILSPFLSLSPSPLPPPPYRSSTSPPPLLRLSSTSPPPLPLSPSPSHSSACSYTSRILFNLSLM